MAKNILLEIGTEEIPARFMPAALERLKQFACIILNRELIEFNSEKITVLGTPRRLVLHVPGVKDVIEQPILGPPRKIALDAEGNYTKAAQGFAKSQGIELTKMDFIDGRLGYINVVRGEGVKEMLSSSLQNIIAGLSFPKSMRWGELKTWPDASSVVTFVRPIHWIVALFGKETLEFELAGIKSSNQSQGHRFLAPEPFEIASADLELYKAVLEKRFVFVDQDKRRNLIQKQITEVVTKTKPGCHVVENKELLEEVNYLVEYPVSLCGLFDSEFLDLPREVLVTCMRQHQKYFVVENKKGQLETAFVVVANLPEKKAGLICSGNERVLRARLSDAQFFYEEDKRVGLSARVESLKGVVFQKDLGSYYDKKERVKKLIDQAFALSSDTYTRVVDLYKADLLTEMVQEFPKLQGIMGEQYARMAGESEAVTVAIREHYLPRFAGDILPQGRVGQILSIADKMDTIVGCFSVGLIPSGSQDPYALRRQALGVVNILLRTEYSLNTLIEKALVNLQSCLKSSATEVKAQVIEFFGQRIQYTLVNKNYSPDLVEATLSAGFEYPTEVEARCEALKELQKKEDWEPLVIAFKRVARIIPPGKEHVDVCWDLFEDEAEKQLYLQFDKLQEEVDNLLKQKNYLLALQKLATLRPTVDRFFDEVMVMCEDKKLQDNRLALLASIAKFFNQLADFSKIATQTT